MSNFNSNLASPDMSGVDYSILRDVEPGSPAHLRAVERIQQAVSQSLWP